MGWMEEVRVSRVQVNAPFGTAGTFADFIFVQWDRDAAPCRCLVDMRQPNAHTAFPAPGNLASWVEMEGLDGFIRCYKPPINKPDIPVDATSLTLRLQALRTEIEGSSPQRDDCVKLTASLLLLEYLRQSTSEERRESLINARLERIIHMMLTEYSHPWHVEELSEMISISPSYFNKLCRRHYGKSPIDMLIDRRIELAKRLLRLPGENVSSVCKTVGFTDIYYFSRMFKKRCGMPPTEYIRGNMVEAMDNW